MITNNYYSKLSLLLLGFLCKLNIFASINIQIFSENGIECWVTRNNLTLMTPNGNTVNAYTSSEGWSSLEKHEIEMFFIQVYSQATYLNEPTTTYNGNGYAWNGVEGGVYCWLNSDSVENSGMHYYWDDTSYVETTQAYATKVFYYSGNHTAVPSSVSGMYESKWSDGPMMRHSIDYGPWYYYMNSRKFYARYPKISGHNIISNTYSGTFTVSCIPKNTTLSWSYDTSKFLKVSSSGTNIKLKPKTTSTVAVSTLTANFKNSAGTVVYTCSFTIYINRLPSISVQSLRVLRSSDGVEVYPSYVGLCPNTFYYAYLTGANPSFSYNWDMNHATVYNSSYNQAYFQTDSQGWTFLDLYATDTTANITEQIYGVTLYDGSSCN